MGRLRSVLMDRYGTGQLYKQGGNGEKTKVSSRLENLARDVAIKAQGNEPTVQNANTGNGTLTRRKKLAI
jgi:hypothetical protein